MRRGGARLVSHNGMPLERQAHKLVVGRIETSVDAMLEVGRSRDLNLLLLFSKHVAGRNAPTALTIPLQHLQRRLNHKRAEI